MAGLRLLPVPERGTALPPKNPEEPVGGGHVWACSGPRPSKGASSGFPGRLSTCLQPCGWSSSTSGTREAHRVSTCSFTEHRFCEHLPCARCCSGLWGTRVSRTERPLLRGAEMEMNTSISQEQKSEHLRKGREGAQSGRWTETEARRWSEAPLCQPRGCEGPGRGQRWEDS